MHELMVRAGCRLCIVETTQLATTTSRRHCLGDDLLGNAEVSRTFVLQSSSRIYDMDAIS